MKHLKGSQGNSKFSLHYWTAVGLIPATLLALLVFVPVILSVAASPATAALPPGFTKQGPGQSCGAGTFAVYGVCAPCRYNPALCSPPVPQPTTPKVTTKNSKGTKTSGDHKVPVSTISKKEAPKYGLGVPNKNRETHPACRVAGGPAYTFTPGQAATGRCSTSANKYFDSKATCPAGTHRRTSGNSGQYWCDSNRKDYNINSRVKGHTVCMRGAIAILSNGSCLYCPNTNTGGRALRRSASVQSRSCRYESAPTTTRVTVPATVAATVPVTVPATSPPSPTSMPPTTVAPVTTVPPTVPPPVTPSTVPTTALPPSLPRVSPGWSPSVAVTQLPLYFWLKKADGTNFTNPPATTWVDSQGRTNTTTVRVTSSVWTFEVVDGAGKRKVDTVTCSGHGAPWRVAWVGTDGQPTAAARADGACWYIYRHMGDGSARGVNVTINWSVHTCQTLPTSKPCTTVSRSSSLSSSISVTEIQALVT